MGMLTKNIHLQLNALVMIPPRTGPSATPSPVIHVQIPIARPRSLSGKASEISARDEGIIMARPGPGAP